MKRDFGKFISKEEIMTRIHALASDLNTKLEERPTIIYFKQVLSAYDRKIEYFNKFLGENMDNLDIT